MLCVGTIFSFEMIQCDMHMHNCLGVYYITIVHYISIRPFSFLYQFLVEIIFFKQKI